MKKILREFFRKSVAAAAGAAILIQAQVPTFVKAAEAPQYISEVYLSYGNTPEEAKKWLTDNGYTVLDQDLNEGAQGGITADWLGWTQLHSEKRSVYLGYKTTTEKDEAITDMRAMNMKGGFSYEEYEKLLESKKTEINSFISDMKAALKEYRENYRKGAAKAKTAHDYLNKITDDDCGSKPLGDLLLEPIKQEMSEKDYKAAPEDHVDMVTLVMQGNTEAVTDIMSYLLLAADTGKDSWLARLEKQGSSDALYEKYEKEYPSLSESKLNAFIISEYDEKAKVLAERIKDLREALKPYTESELKADADDAAVKAYFAEHTDESDVQWSLAATKYIPLTEIEYEGGTLADLVTGEEYDLTKVDDRMVLYPMIESMSKGQRSLIEYVDLGEMVISGNLGEEGWKKTYEDTQKELKDRPSSSAYTGVDRSVFDPAGVALTSEAREIQNTSGASYTNKLFDIDTSTIQIAGYGASTVFLAAGATALLYDSHLDKVKKQVNTAALESIKVEFTEAENNLIKAYNENNNKIAEKIQSYCLNKNIKGISAFTVLSDEGVDPVITEFVSRYYFKKERDFFQERVAMLIDEKHVYWNSNDLIDDLLAYDKSIKELFDTKYTCQKEYEVLMGRQEAVEIKKQNIISKFEPRAKYLKYVGVGLCIAAAVLAVGSAAVTVYDIIKYYHQDYAPIPRKMVHESSDKRGRMVYTVYDCVLCNRTAQGFGLDKLGDYGDMNGDVGKQWLALYTTRDKAAGDPIRADIIAQKGSNKMPLDKSTGIRMFGKTDTVNIVSEEYGYKDALKGLYIFASTESEDSTTKAAEKPAETKPAETKPAETAPAETKAVEGSVTPAEGATKQQPESTGTVVGSGSLVLTGVLSAAAGAVICFLLTRKKREEDKAA